MRIGGILVNNRVLIAIDSGKHGAISFFHDGKLDHVIDMPLMKILTKKEVRVFKHKDPRAVYKSGKNKGQRPTKIKSPAKYKTEIDFNAVINEIMKYQALVNPYADFMDNDIFTMAIEEQFMLPNQGHSKPIFLNHGKLVGIGYVLCEKVIEIKASAWKKHYGLGKDKENSIKLAKKIFDWNFNDKKDGQHESALIGKYYLDTGT